MLGVVKTGVIGVMIVLACVVVVVVDDGLAGMPVAVGAAAEAVEERFHAFKSHLAHSDPGCSLECAAQEAAAGRRVGHGLGVCGSIGWRVGRWVAGVVDRLILRLLCIAGATEDLA